MRRKRRSVVGVDTPMPLTDHLAELRRRLVRALGAIAAGSIIGWIWVPDVLHILEALSGPLVFTSPAGALTTRLRIAVSVGLLLGLPVAVWQAWGFVLPGLLPHERRVAHRILPAACALFVVGLGLGALGVFPLTLRFFLGFTGDPAVEFLSVAELVGFAMGTTIPFGLAFQVPLVVVVMARAGALDLVWLRQGRRQVVLLAFVTAGFLTPRGVLSQVLLAVPVWLLFELGLWIAGRSQPIEEEA